MYYVKKAHYYKSLSHDTLPRKSLPRSFYKELDKFYDSSSAKDRREILYNMTKILNKHFKLPHCGLRVYNHKRPYLAGRANYWLKGLYTHNTRGLSLIELWNFSENNRRLSPLQILNVYLHEYIHHYDFKALKVHINHDSGFWKRLQYLRGLVFKKDE